ncbi:hypothetical protein Dimus_005936, partial [Dionaea muscipula]
MLKLIAQLMKQVSIKQKGKGKVEKDNVKGVNAIATISGQSKQESPVDDSTTESKVKHKEKSPGKIEALSEEPDISNYELK